MLPSSTYSTLTVRYGGDVAEVPWSSRHKAIDVAKKLVELHTPEMPSWLATRFGITSKPVPYKIFVEVGGAASFVCGDLQQLEVSLSVSSGMNAPAKGSSSTATVEVVVLAALSLSGDGKPQFQKLYRSDVQLLQGALDVLLSTSSEVIGRLPFDKARPSTLSELESAVDELPWVLRWKRSCSDQKLLNVDVELGWRVVGTSASRPTGATMRIDGEADTRALANDVRVYGHANVAIILTLPSLRPDDGALSAPVPSTSGMKSQAPNINQTASRVLNKHARPSSATTTRYQQGEGATTPQQRSISPSTTGALRSGRMRPQSAMSNTPQQAQTVSAGGRMKSARPGAPSVDELFDHEDSDVDYITISYVLNPPVITIVGFLEDTQLTSLAETILKECVSEGRLAALRTGPPAFLRMVQNVGVFPSYQMTFPKWYFDEVQELSLILAILDAVEELHVFRMVPLDGMCEKDQTNSIYEQRAKSRMMLSMGNARAAVGGGEMTQVASKRSAQFLFMPR